MVRHSVDRGETIEMERFHLASNIKVRKERFGILIYNTEDTNLKIIKSGNLISPEQLENEEQLNTLMQQALTDCLIAPIIEQLVSWGFIIREKL